MSLVVYLSPRSTGFDTRYFHVRLLVDKVALWQVLLRVLLFSACRYHSTNAPYSSSSTCCSYKTHKVAMSGNVTKPNDISEIVDSQMQNYVHLIIRLQMLRPLPLFACCEVKKKKSIIKQISCHSKYSFSVLRATSRKVASSIPGGFVGNFHPLPPSGRTVVLGLN